jgi:hypothetical protein
LTGTALGGTVSLESFSDRGVSKAYLDAAALEGIVDSIKEKMSEWASKASDFIKSIAQKMTNVIGGVIRWVKDLFGKTTPEQQQAFDGSKMRGGTTQSLVIIAGSIAAMLLMLNKIGHTPLAGMQRASNAIIKALGGDTLFNVSTKGAKIVLTPVPPAEFKKVAVLSWQNIKFGGGIVLRTLGDLVGKVTSAIAGIFTKSPTAATVAASAGAAAGGGGFFAGLRMKLSWIKTIIVDGIMWCVRQMRVRFSKMTAWFRRSSAGKNIVKEAKEAGAKAYAAAKQTK